jgi:insulysin
MVGRGDTATGYDFFKITAELTEQGEENVLGVLRLIFQYINMLRKERPVKWIFDEVNYVCELEFNYGDMDDPIDYVTELSSKMQRYVGLLYVN